MANTVPCAVDVNSEAHNRLGSSKSKLLLQSNCCHLLFLLLPVKARSHMNIDLCSVKALAVRSSGLKRRFIVTTIEWLVCVIF